MYEGRLGWGGADGNRRGKFKVSTTRALSAVCHNLTEILNYSYGNSSVIRSGGHTLSARPVHLTADILTDTHIHTLARTRLPCSSRSTVADRYIRRII